MGYNKTVNHSLDYGRSPYWLGATPIERRGYRQPRALSVIPAARNYWNAGVNMSYRGKPPKPHRLSVTAAQYFNAGVNVAYGNVNQLGDLFNDIMGAVVPGWDARPQWMKNIVIKPDPSKILAAAQKVAPQAAGQIVGAAERAGLNVFVNTPAGQVPVSPATAQSLYAGYPMFAQAQSALGSIPTMAWVAGGGAILLLVLTMKK